MPKRHAILPVKDVNQQVFVRRLAHYLKKSKKVKLPEWVDVVKTSCAKELPPNTQDWLYVRMAAVIRRVYMRCPSGVGALSRRFGSKNKRRGVRPNHTRQGARGVIRYSLQQFEKMGWVRKAERGRKLTGAGRLFMDEFSGRLKRSPMVAAYWRRRKKQTRLKRKLERKKQMEATGGDTAGQDAPAEDAEIAADYVDVQAGQEDIEVVNEYEA